MATAGKKTKAALAKKKKQEPGRPSKLTKARKSRLLRALKNGNFIDTACRYAGIGTSTFYRWLEKGKKSKSGEYRELWDEVEGALAEAEIKVVEKWRGHFPESPQACRDFLQARWRKRWGKDLEVEAPDPGGPVSIALTVRHKGPTGESEERPADIPINEL